MVGHGVQLGGDPARRNRVARRVDRLIGQWIRRTNPQTWQRATPVAVSTSRKLVQPLVLQ
jgi:hypothetical protein